MAISADGGPPKFTTAQRLALVSPGAGLLVYDIDFGQNFLYSGVLLDWVPQS